MDSVIENCTGLKNALAENKPSYRYHTTAEALQQKINDAEDHVPTTIVLNSKAFAKYDSYRYIHQIVIPANKDIILTDDGVTDFSLKPSTVFFKGQMFIVEEGAKLTIDAPKLTLSFTSTYKTLAENQGIAVNVFGEFNLKNGIIKGGDNFAYSGCGMVRVNNGATFNMSGGTIKGAKINKTDLAYVAPVVVPSGAAFHMSGGQISGNQMNVPFNIEDKRKVLSLASSGVLVYTLEEDDPEAVMTLSDDALITENTTVQAGGGILVAGNARLTMTGGTISKNSAAYNGGGVCVSLLATSQPATNNAPAAPYFTMDGGTISGNTSGNYGGGVYINSNGVTLQGGVIENNAATLLGGGVYVSTMPYTAHLYNVLITGNTASTSGGGLWFCPTGDAQIYVTKGAGIFGNSAKNNVGRPSAGDDFVFLGRQGSTLHLSERMLGGGKTAWYQDGGVKRNNNSDMLEYLETGAVLSDVPRYSPAKPGTPITDLNGSKHYALKSVPQDEAAQLAASKAKLFIRGNTAWQGGGICANGSIVIGEKDTYTLEIVKEWDETIPEAQRQSVTIRLVICGYKLDTVELNRENNWTASFTGLPMLDDMTEVTVMENGASQSFIPQISEIEEAGNKLYRIHILNLPVPVVDLPKTGDDSHAALWFALMFLSAAGLGLCLSSRKRSRA